MKFLSQQKFGVLFLDTTKFDLYLPNGTVVSYSLPPTLVRDLEVLEKDTLAAQITGFIDTNKIPPITLIFVLSERILFSRDFANTADLQEQVVVVQEFLDSIPFDNLSTKTFKLEKGFKVVAANHDFYENIKAPFETKGFIIEAVAPITVLGSELATITVLNRDLAKKIIAKMNIIKQNALEIHYEASTTPKTSEADDEKKAYKIRLYAMGGVFGLLFIIMGVMAYQTFKPEPRAPQGAITPAPIAPTTIPLTPTKSVDEALKKTLQIAISSPTRPSTFSAALRTNLLDAGYNNVQISTKNSPSTGLTRTKILFKSTVPDTIRLDIVTIVNSIFANPLVVEQKENTEDISILTQ